MSQTDNKYSTQNVTPQLIAQVVEALKNKAYGSVEIYVENYSVVQITERTITKVQRTSANKRFHFIRNNGNSRGYTQASDKTALAKAQNTLG